MNRRGQQNRKKGTRIAEIKRNRGLKVRKRRQILYHRVTVERETKQLEREKGRERKEERESFRKRPPCRKRKF